MKKTYIINDIFWITIALLVCLGGYNLGFGTFQRPSPGFMPILCGLLLGFLAFVDLISGFVNRWKAEKEDKEIWSGINWGKLILTLGVLFVYTALFSTLGFVIGTILLLLFLFRLMESRAWWIILMGSAAIVALFYLGFKVGLDSQLPRGFLGF